MRLKRTSALYMTIVNTLLFLFLVAFATFEEQQSAYDCLSNKMHFNNVLRLYDPENVNWDNPLFDDNCRVSYELNENSRVILKDSTNWSPPMLEGYYPEEEEKNESIAVVGKNVTDILIAENDKKFLEYEGQRYRVTGVVGAEYVTSCDDAIILFNTQVRDYGKGTYLIDSEDSDCINRIEDYFKENSVETKIERGSIKGTARLTKTSYFFRLFYIEAAVLTGFTLLAFENQWNGRRERKRMVYFIHGFPVIGIVLSEMIATIFANIVAFCLALLLSALIGVYEVKMLKKLILICCVVLGISLAMIITNALLGAQNSRTETGRNRSKGG